MNSLLYVSRRRHAGLDGGELDDILATARSRNAALGVTGSLVATPLHYAQMLEGPEGALAELMESIERDERHADIRLAHLRPKPRRDLARWSLAYHGESTYVSELVTAAIDSPDFSQPESFEAIRSLMLMFA